MRLMKFRLARTSSDEGLLDGTFEKRSQRVVQPMTCPPRRLERLPLRRSRVLPPSLSSSEGRCVSEQAELRKLVGRTSNS